MNRTVEISRRNFLKEPGRFASGFLLLQPLSLFPLGRERAGEFVYIERVFYTMGTMATISAYGQERAHVQQAITKAINAIQRVDDLMSLYKPGSRISAINQAAGRHLVPVEKELTEILSKARHFYSLTQGAFDITIEPLMELWGFRKRDREPSRVPSDSEVQRQLDAVGFRNLVVDATTQSVGLLNERSKVDLGGIAVGFSVDRAVAVLRNEGIISAFINHSGDAYAIGSPPDSEGWEIGIPNPLNRNEIVSNLRLQDNAVSSSGNYEKYVAAGGERFGHILNPNSGRPSSAMLGATIIAPTSMEADALSTGLFCTGIDSTRAIVKELHGTRAILITGDERHLDVSSV